MMHDYARGDAARPVLRGAWGTCAGDWLHMCGYHASFSFAQARVRDVCVCDCEQKTWL